MLRNGVFNMETTWNDLREGKEVLLSNQEIDKLQEYVDTLPEGEQDVYYKRFVSRFSSKHAYGLLSRSYVCKLR